MDSFMKIKWPDVLENTWKTLKLNAWIKMLLLGLYSSHCVSSQEHHEVPVRSWYQWMLVAVCVACQSRQMVQWPFSAVCAFLFLLDLRTWNEKRDKCPLYLKVLKIIRKRVLLKIRILLINHLNPILYVWCFQFSLASRFLFLKKKKKKKRNREKP